MSSKRFCTRIAPASLCFLLIANSLRAELPQPGDIVLGMNRSDAAETLELLRGPATTNGAVMLASPWSTTSFLQSVEFDNLDGVRHNQDGNLLALDFGGSFSMGTGLIYSLGTNGSEPLPAAQLIGNTRADTPIGHSGGVTLSRLTSISASPDNTKISVVGVDTGSIIVYDYTAGDGMGSGASLSGGRESAALTVTSGGTSAATWIDNDTIIAFGNDGNLMEVEPTTMIATDVGGVFTPFVGSNFSALAYNPEVSPFLYASYSGFTTGMTTNKLYVFDPAANYNLVREIDLSTSLQTAREIALDADGNLFMGAFGGAIEFLPAANILNPTSLTDNSTVDWYDSANNSSFTGLDIGFGELIVDFADGDFDEDGDVDVDDLDDWKTGFGKLAGAVHGDGDADADGDVDGADFLTWQRELGAPPPPPVAAIPEPATASLLLLASTLIHAVRRQTCH
ncbi:MAG TPA: hypothetical protein VF175_01555 [Lacipirellula sp.]